jgi:ribosomal protein S19
MTRSRWKGPFVDAYLLKKVKEKEHNKGDAIKT